MPQVQSCLWSLNQMAPTVFLTARSDASHSPWCSVLEPTLPALTTPHPCLHCLGPFCTFLTPSLSHGCTLSPDPVTFPVLPVLFAEEPGLVLEVEEAHLAQVLRHYWVVGLHCLKLGHTGAAGPHSLVRRAICFVEGVAVSPLCWPRRAWDWAPFLLALDKYTPLPRCTCQ